MLGNVLRKDFHFIISKNIFSCGEIKTRLSDIHLAVGFVIEYRAVNTSIEHNLTVATGDILNVMDDAEKIGKREVLIIKRLGMKRCQLPQPDP